MITNVLTFFQTKNKNIILIFFMFISFLFKLLLLMEFNLDFFSNEILLLYILSKYIFIFILEA
jgi:hypothetical protein